VALAITSRVGDYAQCGGTGAPTRHHRGDRARGQAATTPEKPSGVNELVTLHPLACLFLVSTTRPHVCRFEQAFSDDGGKSWEVTCIATDTGARQ
jgi:hypothetical protein